MNFGLGFEGHRGNTHMELNPNFFPLRYLCHHLGMVNLHEVPLYSWEKCGSQVETCFLKWDNVVNVVWSQTDLT